MRSVYQWCSFSDKRPLQTFSGRSNVLKNNKIPITPRTRLFQQCDLPVLTYGAQTWTITMLSMENLSITQRAMERQILNITWRNRTKNGWIRNVTKQRDIAKEIAKIKWDHAKHMARYGDQRWNENEIGTGSSLPEKYEKSVCSEMNPRWLKNKKTYFAAVVMCVFRADQKQFLALYTPSPCGRDKQTHLTVFLHLLYNSSFANINSIVAKNIIFLSWIPSILSK